MTLQDFIKFIEARSGLFAVAAAVLVVFLVAAIWWILRPDYVTLSKEGTEAAQADILATLGQWQIPYRINAKEGAIEVKQDDLASARIHLAEAGIPNRNGVGFELFDHADYGMSEFSQKINYQRALEGELSRSIMTLREIKYARVHLTLKKASFYQNAQDQPKASVIVHLRPNIVLNAQQVQGIQNLVASAVEGIQKGNVTVLSEEGRVLNVDEDDAPAVHDRMQASAKLEQELQQKAEQLLQHSLGVAGAYVSVRVQMNFDHVKSVREQPLPKENNVVVREKQHSTSSESQDDTDGKHSQSTREVEYAVGQERSETEYSTGRVERVSVGVALSSPMPDSSMQEMRNLLEAALGLNEERGDRLEIAYMEAVVPSERPLAIPYAEEPETHDGNIATGILPKATMALIALIVLLVFALLWSIYGRRRVQAASAKLSPMSPDEREQLLLDLRRWMKEDH